MPSRLAPNQLDELLALQLTAAWAGEAAGEPARLGWWKTDLVDPQGGGDLFARLVPRTAAWASLSLVRAAARRIDAMGRKSLARGDDVWTPFHLGFVVDEQIDDRIAYHRTHGHVPADVLGPRFLAGTPWSKPAFEALLKSLGAPKVTVSPAGRPITALAASPADAAPLLFAALTPLAASYPLPYLEAAT
ncbi:MAG TPA: BREX-6 system BrxE protein [Polyangiaceae bacterium]|nr:BREX-6 system BrxE protein [Polyangiaceae bacterium]